MDHQPVVACQAYCYAFAETPETCDSAADCLIDWRYGCAQEKGTVEGDVFERLAHEAVFQRLQVGANVGQFGHGDYSMPIFAGKLGQGAQLAGPVRRVSSRVEGKQRLSPGLMHSDVRIGAIEARPIRSVRRVKQSIVHIALVVRDYDEAIEFYTKTLRFTLVEDTYQPEQDKRWVVVAPPGSRGTTLLLARASKPAQEAFVGNQTGGRVFLFLNTDDFWRDYKEMIDRGVNFVREPKTESYGIVAVFEDLYGNLWDLLQLNRG